MLPLSLDPNSAKKLLAMADGIKELLSHRVTTFTSNKDCILDAQHAKLEEISCSMYGSHPAIKLRYSCVSSQSTPCQPLLQAHLLARCASGLLPPLSGVFSPFLTQNATESVSTSVVTRMPRFVLQRAAAGDGP